MSVIADKLLAVPLIYDSFQSLVGAPKCHARFIAEMVRPIAGERILDLGCGVGASVDHLPQPISYVGVDISESYIKTARSRFGDRGKFICADVNSIDAQSLGMFDRAFSFGVLHHLSDSIVRRVTELLRSVVRPGGLFVTIDPCYAPNQPALAKFLIDRDRGEYVRDQPGYEQLMSGLGNVSSRVFHDLLRIPYTQIVMQIALPS